MNSPTTTLRPTLFGLVAISGIVLSIAVGLFSFSVPLLAIGLAAAMIVLLCRAVAPRAITKLTVQRILPRHARVGESFAMELCFRCDDSIAPSSLLHFTDPIAPSLRNRLLPPSLLSDGRLPCTGLVHRRGRLAKQAWRMISNWPFGLFEVERRGIYQDRSALLVHPKPWLPPGLRERLDQLTLEAARQGFEPPDPLAEFRLLREFRPGDAVRAIHWPSTLRLQSLYTIETEAPSHKPRRYGIIMHSCEAPGSIVTPDSYELILRIVTGLLLRFQREEILVLFSQAPGAIKTLSHHDDFSKILDHLALSTRRPLRSLEFFETIGRHDPERDRFALCDEIFIVGDGEQDYWAPSARTRFPHATCLDPSSLSLGSRPQLRTSSTVKR